MQTRIKRKNKQAEIPKTDHEFIVFGIFFEKRLTKRKKRGIISTLSKHAGVAELADALDSGSSGSNLVEVQVLSPALFFCLKTKMDRHIGIKTGVCRIIYVI